ncbi:MAG: GAF domain-containing protein [Bacteroidales bacterium]
METFVSTVAGKEATYKEILSQIQSITEGETDTIANMANISAILKEAFGLWWVGFYLVKDSQLVLGPFQGPLACTRIQYGRGVCGTTWRQGSTIVVPDVEQFPGHIACSSLSRSEIVVPVFNKEGRVTAVLDIDSKDLNSFDSIDAKYLEQIASILQ